MQQPKSFDAIEIGDEIGPVYKTPTKADVLNYAEAVRITGLKFFFHKKDAEQAGLTKPIIPGPLSTTYLCQMLQDFFVSRLAAAQPEHDLSHARAPRRHDCAVGHDYREERGRRRADRVLRPGR